MEPAPALIAQSNGGSAPSSVPFAPGADMEVVAASAVFNGAAASGTFLACMAVYSQSGILIGRWFPSQRFAVGDSGEVTFSPFSGGASLDGVTRFQVIAFGPTDSVVVGDLAMFFFVTSDMNGMSLVEVGAGVSTVSSAGTPTVQLRNVTTGNDMLSTKVTIDANERTSYTAATPPVINTANAIGATGDLIAVDVDVAGTGTKGLDVFVGYA
jgi:hypothetical protein